MSSQRSLSPAGHPSWSQTAPGHPPHWGQAPGKPLPLTRWQAARSSQGSRHPPRRQKVCRVANTCLWKHRANHRKTEGRSARNRLKPLLSQSCGMSSSCMSPTTDIITEGEFCRSKLLARSANSSPIATPTQTALHVFSEVSQSCGALPGPGGKQAVFAGLSSPSSPHQNGRQKVCRVANTCLLWKHRANRPRTPSSCGTLYCRLKGLVRTLQTRKPEGRPPNQEIGSSPCCLSPVG